MATRARLAMLLVLSTVAAGQVDQECVSRAIAATAPGTGAAEALSNAVAQTLTESVVCERGAAPQSGSVGGLSVAVALAISEANDIGMSCTADAEAAAEFATDFVTDGLADELLVQTKDDGRRMMAAWLEAMGPDVRGLVGQASGLVGADGCLDLDSLSGGLPTAVQLGMLVSDAVQQVVEAVSCGTNVEEGGEGCVWAERKFTGECVGPRGAWEGPKGGSKDKAACRSDFRKCWKDPVGRDCTGALTACLEAATDCQYC